MALEIHALIRKLQGELRTAAGIPRYDPEDGNCFPRLSEVVAESDPSPPYLRCGQCRGKLLRGVNSTICVYCGAHQHRDDASAPSISFYSTLACRGFLDFLQVDGSETVVLNPTDGKSPRKKDASQEGLILSDLLNFELKWPKESTRTETSSTEEKANAEQKKETTFIGSAVNLAGVDLDNFFSDAKTETDATTSMENSVTGRQINDGENSLSVQEGSSMFQSDKSSDMQAVIVGKATDEVADSFSLWEADFQSAGSIASPLESKTVDPFQGLPTTTHAETVFSTPRLDSNTDMENSTKTQDNIIGSESTWDHFPSDWTEANVQRTGNASSIADTEQFVIGKQSNTVEEKDVSGVLSGEEKHSQDDIWSTFNQSISTNTEKADDNDSLDVWQDFSSSGPADLSLSSQPQADPGVMHTDGHASISRVLTDAMEESGLDTFFQQGHSVASSNQKQTETMDFLELEFFSSNRMEGTEAESRPEPAADNVGVKLTTEAKTQMASCDPNVAMLVSQMPDLSFMLENKLSIPEKANDTNVHL